MRQPIPRNNVKQVFEEYRERLISFVRNRLTVKDDAEDIVQEIFYQLLRANEIAKPVEQIAAWLFRVAKNMVINWQKKKRDIPFSVLTSVNEDNNDELNDIMDILASDDTTPETETLKLFIWEEIEKALDELPKPQREIFIQTEFLNFSVKEISQKTNIPVNTLLSRKHYAVKHLRKRLKDLYSGL
jgi:RNA polymerase sigma factor (sigma-70 family)